MCNAWNHWWGCDCGFGGDTGGPGSWPGEGWTLSTSRDSVTHPSTCPWCGAAVYFFRDAHGGCAFFDELGAPWQVHPCWEDYRHEVRYALRHVEEQLDERGYVGTLTGYLYEAARAPDGFRRLQPFWGIVMDRDLWTDVGSLGDSDLHSADWYEVPVLFGTTRYDVWFLDEDVEALAPKEPVLVHARWVHTDWEVALLATAVERQRMDGLRLYRRRSKGLEEDVLRCAFCGTRVRGDEGWGITNELAVECEPCRSMRGDLAPREFRRLCRKVARHLQE